MMATVDSCRKGTYFRARGYFLDFDEVGSEDIDD